jgi:transposase
VDAILGIDMGKSEFHCALVVDDQLRSNSFSNTPSGFKKLASWLRNRKIVKVHACLESTGGWSEELGTFLHEAGHIVSIANAAAIKAFGQSELSRSDRTLLSSNEPSHLEPTQPFRAAFAAFRAAPRCARGNAGTRNKPAARPGDR